MKTFVKILLIVFIFMIGILTYSRYVGTMGLITKEYSLYHKDLPTSYDGLKIVHFSDIHYNRAINEEKVNDIVREINLINPDVVVFTGDLIDKDVNLNESDYTFLINSFSNIKSKYGKYAILGNHDYSDKDNVIDVYEKSGFNYLENSYDIIFNNNGEKIFIGGVGNVTYNVDNVEKTLEYFNNDDTTYYSVILVHEPDISDNIVNNHDIDLILGGHSHNGQVRLPVVGAVYTPGGSKKYYDEYYDLSGTDLYISSGIGVSIINYRLFNRPSINFYRINKEQT